MTPQLRQAISLLQLTNLELAARLAEEADKNPLLEISEPVAEHVDVPEKQTAEVHDVPDYDFRSSVGTKSNETLDFDRVQNIEYRPPLRESLIQQLQLAIRDPMICRIAQALVDELDERGWLGTSIDELAARYGIPSIDIIEALKHLQACEPAGIAARDLQECLELQLEEAGELSNVTKAITSNLALLGKSRYSELEQLAGVGRAELESAISKIRNLNPRPVMGYSNDIIQTAIADVNVSPSATDGWLVEVNTDNLPTMLVNEKYATEIAKDGTTTSEYLHTCRADARFLVKALDQRTKTILRVATVIVRHQSRFFSEGLAGLRPLTLGSVAQELGIHESTVSRVTTGKYLYCLRGTFELRFFFVTGLSRNDGGSDVAAPLVREKIKKLVVAEGPDRPLSDEKLSILLKDDGVDVARRTVAKYREAMGIPSSSRRRRKHT